MLTTAGKHQRQLYANKGSSFLWKQGRVYHIDGSEMMYVHFHKLKDSLAEINFSYQDDPQAFAITSSGLFVR